MPKTNNAIWKKKRLLIIEDAPIISKYFRHILAKSEIEIISCSTGTEGKSYFYNESFDAVLTDINLPDLDGLLMIEEMKSLRPEVPVIVQSGYCLESDIKKIKATGCNHYLCKPVKPDELHTALKQVFDE